MNYQDTTVIIPTLNEADNIGYLITKLTYRYPNIKVIVVDDGSTDKTKEIAGSMHSCTVLDRTNEKIHGLTISVLDGIKTADTKYCIIMDADGQHPVNTISNLIKCLRSGADIAVGTRKDNTNMGLDRKLISWGAIVLGQISLLSRGTPLCEDIVSGFFGIRRDIAIHHIIFNYNRFTLEGYKVLFDLLKVLPNTITVDEVYYNFGTRKHGHSKMRLKHIKLFFTSLLR